MIVNRLPSDEDEPSRSTRELRVGDEVEARVPCVVAEDGTIVDRRTRTRFWASAAYAVTCGVELVVTLPIDHPSRDPVGTVRGAGQDVWVKVAPYTNGAGEPHTVGVWWNVYTHEERTGDDVEEWPVTGSLPSSALPNDCADARRGSS